jgi:endonuclease/exonuclease/phosphatase (EEP) superfamily protein YafD
MKPYLHRLIEHAALLGVLFTLAGLFGKQAWFFELFTHFKVQLAACFILYAGIECLARHTHHAVAALAFAAVNALPAAQLVLLPSGSAAHPQAVHEQHLRILQANILTSNTNAPALLALIAREKPDVILLQEPNARWLRDLASLTNAYPVFAAEPREDNFGAALFARRARSAEIVHFDDPERAPSTRARIDLGGRTLTVMGTHPLAPYCAYTWHGRNRYTLDLARLLRDTPGPRVVTGDFNNTPWSLNLQAFLNLGGLLDSAQGRALQATWPTFLPSPLRIPIDHCFHSADVRIAGRRLGPDIGSDHLPLLIDLVF